MNPSPEIRSGAKAEHEWCARLMASSEPWITLRQDLSACRDKLTRAESELYVAHRENGSNPLGLVLVSPFGFAGSPYISSLCVAPDARGQGVGAALLRFVEKRFSGRRRLFLLVSSFNSRAQRFYRREGFEFIAELNDYVVAGHAELIFSKRLA